MVSSTNDTLLTAYDPPPVLVDNPSGSSQFLFIGDHAGNGIPVQLQKLGLEDDDLARHIGWDIGIRALGGCLAERLDATFIHQHYSRLVIDCNRGPDAVDSIPAVSDATAIPGNENLDPKAKAHREQAIHRPYQEAIAAELGRRDKAGRRTILVALHSFTPAMTGVARPWHAGILHNGGNVEFALALLLRLREDRGLRVGDNEPYQMDGVDYTVPLHAFAAARPYAEIEIRQDLLGEPDGIARWCDILGNALTATANAGHDSDRA